MSAIAVSPGSHAQERWHLPPLAGVVLLLLVGVTSLVVFALVTIDVGTQTDVRLRDPWSSWSRTGAAQAPVTADVAIETWIAEHRADLFLGYDEPFIGRCPSGPSTQVSGLCTSPVEDLGDHRIDLVGVYATDWGADLLLERTTLGWSVVDAARWPELGDPGWFGPPWSPQTAIGRWWATEQRAAGAYGAGAVHLRSCAEAGDVLATTQPLLCSTLVADQGDERVYATGRAGTGDAPDYELVLREEADHTWSVIEARALTQ